MKYLNKTNFKLFILFVLVLTLYSCAKIKHDKIDGTWIRFRVTEINPEFNEYWIFENNELIIEKEVMLIMPGDTVETRQNVVYEQGAYEVSAKMTKSFVKISGFVLDEFYTFNKKWQIINLDKEVFSLSSSVGNGAQYLEFYRE